MNCFQTRNLLCSYLDSALQSSEMRQVRQHLDECAECAAELAELRRTQQIVAAAGRLQPPPELALRLQIAISHAAVRRPSLAQRLRAHIQALCSGMMGPATAGVVSTLAIFAMLIGSLMPSSASAYAKGDEPGLFHTPPQLASSPFSSVVSNDASGVLVVEASIDSHGRVQGFCILQAPDNAKELMPEIKNMLLFSVFRPATSFGAPTSGTVVLTFSVVDVHA